MDFDSTVNTIKEFFQGLVTNFGAGTVVDGIILLFLLFTMIMGCTCETKYGYKRICKDGPVLVKEEIKW